MTGLHDWINGPLEVAGFDFGPPQPGPFVVHVRRPVVRLDGPGPDGPVTIVGQLGYRCVDGRRDPPEAQRD